VIQSLPITVLGGVMPRTQPKPPIKLARLDNERDYLTPDEMERLLNGAKKGGRYPHRD
jgi:hypothetical protein